MYDQFTQTHLTSNTSATTWSTVGTTAGSITISNLEYPNYQQYDYRMQQSYQTAKIKVGGKKVKADILNNFPFKKNDYQGFSEQLQGEFDSWIGNLRTELFA